MTDKQDNKAPNEAVHAVMVEIHHDFLRFLTRRLGNEDGAADVLHDFYVKVLTRIGDVRETKKLRAWMCRVLRKSLVDYYRAQGKSAKSRRSTTISKRCVLQATTKTPWISSSACASTNFCLP